MASGQTKIDNLGAVVLCGGKSKRMGFDKWKLPIGKHDAKPITLIEYISDHISASITPLVICTGSVASKQIAIDRYPLIPDSTQRLGPMEGIRVGLKSLEDACEYAYVTACDIPYFNFEMVKFLFQQIESYDAIFPVEKKRVFGLNAIYKTNLHRRIPELIADNRLRVSQLATVANSKQVASSELRRFDPDLKFLRNINSPTDYFELLKELGIECDVSVHRLLNES